LQVLRIIQEEAMKENTAAIHCQVPVDVAAFLLNEKRAEVIKIESRFKVNVLLLPNKHLETPHYKLERLRHDDPRLDDPKASYAMAEEASKELESDTILNRKAEEAKPRQEAAVKGVRPSQPAPTSVPRAERKAAGEKESSGGLIGFIKKLFGAKEEAKPAEKRQAGNREGRNGDRNRNNRNRNNRNRNKNEAGERNQAGRDAANGEEKSDNKEARQPNQRNGRNQQRQNKPEANQEAKAEQAKDLLTHAEVPQAAEGSEGDERRRGRNRRGRNRGRDRAERGENNAEATTEVTTSTETTATAAIAPVAATAVSETVQTTYVAPTVAESSAPASTSTAAVDSAPVVTSTPAELTAPVVAAPAPLPKVEFKPLQTSELTSVIESAGMIWVNTDNQKLEEVRAQIAAEPAIVYPPREPKPPVEISTGPMVLVETGGKEQTIQK